MTNQDNDAMRIAYLALGRLVARECPAGFQTARMQVEPDAVATQLLVTATQPDGTEVQMRLGPDAVRDILESLRGIRNAMAREGGEVWRRCVVTLKAGGGFAMEVEF